MPLSYIVYSPSLWLPNCLLVYKLPHMLFFCTYSLTKSPHQSTHLYFFLLLPFWPLFGSFGFDSVFLSTIVVGIVFVMANCASACFARKTTLAPISEREKRKAYWIWSVRMCEDRHRRQHSEDADTMSPSLMTTPDTLGSFPYDRRVNCSDTSKNLKTESKR